jgi:hypothetical protein
MLLILEGFDRLLEAFVPQVIQKQQITAVTSFRHRGKQHF